MPLFHLSPSSVSEEATCCCTATSPAALLGKLPQVCVASQGLALGEGQGEGRGLKPQIHDSKKLLAKTEVGQRLSEGRCNNLGTGLWWDA